MENNIYKTDETSIKQEQIIITKQSKTAIEQLNEIAKHIALLYQNKKIIEYIPKQYKRNKIPQEIDKYISLKIWDDFNINGYENMGQFLKKIIQYKHEGFREEKNINIEKLIKDKMLITEQLQKCDKNSKNYLNLQNVLNKIELNINEINEKNINDIDKFIIYVKKALIIFNKNSKNANILLSLIKDNLNKNKYKQKNNEKPKEIKQQKEEYYTPPNATFNHHYTPPHLKQNEQIKQEEYKPKKYNNPKEYKPIEFNKPREYKPRDFYNERYYIPKQVIQEKTNVNSTKQFPILVKQDIITEYNNIWNNLDKVKQHDKESYTDNSKIVQTTKNKRKKIKVFYYDEEEEIEKFEWKYEDEVIEYSDEVEELEEISSPYISDKSIDYVKHDEDD